MSEVNYKGIKGFPTEDEVPKPFSNIPIFGKYPDKIEQFNREIYLKYIANTDECKEES